MKRLAASLAVALCLSIAHHEASATTYSIGYMNITGGGFSVDGFPDGFVAFSYIGPNTNLVGGYIGSGGAGVDAFTPNPSRIADTTWYDLPMSLYTAASSLGDTNNSPAGNYTGGPVPSGVLDDVAYTISMDLGSWFANWNNGDYITGTGRNDGTTSAMATGTWNPITGAYVLHWDSLTFGPECMACVGHWTLEGTAFAASPVPIPAALWLFGSGLLSLIGLQWRRKFGRR